jgi:hypothetical protein
VYAQALHLYVTILLHLTVPVSTTGGKLWQGSSGLVTLCWMITM